MSTKKETAAEKTEVISIRLPKDDVKKLDKMVRQLDITRSKLVVIALRSVLK